MPASDQSLSIPQMAIKIKLMYSLFQIYASVMHKFAFKSVQTPSASVLSTEKKIQSFFN